MHVLVVTWAGCLPAAADDAGLPLPNFLPKRWDTDVPGAANEIQLRQLPCTVNSLSLRFRIDETNLDPEAKYEPLITIRIGTGPYRDLSAPGSEGATFFVQPDPQTLRSVVGFVKENNTGASDLSLLGLLGRGEEGAVMLTWTAGAVKARLNDGKPVTISLSRPPTLLLMTASGVKATFQDIRASLSEGGPPAACSGAQDLEVQARARPDPAASLEIGCVRKIEVAEIDPALQACTRLINAHIGSKQELAAAYAARAFMYLDKGLIEAADQDATEALALDPNHAASHIIQAAILTRRGLAEKALLEADTAVKLEPNNDRAYNYRGMDEHILSVSAERSGAAKNGAIGWQAVEEKAINDFNHAIQLNPDAADYYYNREIAFQRIGKFAEAVSDADKLKSLEPNANSSWNGACRARAMWGQQLDTALVDCDKAVMREPGNATYLDSRCLVKFRMGRYPEADADCTAALKVYPRLAGSLYIRGLASMKAGQGKAGEADLSAARQIDPKIDEIYARYGIPSDR
ncbi:MAG TPA: hypothetical protein VG892_03365 [Terriglobales bacterium]|nr:hypothetical protein [Terriglobales bacterium]